MIMELANGDRKAILLAFDKMYEYVQNCSEDDLEEIMNSKILSVGLSSSEDLMLCKFSIQRREK